MPRIARAQSLKRVRFLTSIKSLDESYAPVIVAKHVGFFRDDGIDVELLPVGGSNEVAIQISAGNGEIGAASPGQAIVGMQPQPNLALQYFYDMLYSSIWMISVPVESSAKSLADLKGKKLGVTSMGSAGVTFGRAFLSSAGLDPSTDITFVAIGNGAQAVTAVRQGMVDGLMFWDTAVAKFHTSGLRLRNLPLPVQISKLPDVSLLAQPDFLEKNPRIAIGTGRALAKGLDFCLANPEAAVRIVWKNYPESRPALLTEEAAVTQTISAMNARLQSWNDPRAKDQHGLFIESSWGDLMQLMVSQGLISKAVPLERALTNKFIPEINHYDRAAVISIAKSFDVKALN
jgi:NitT/TauT family transport system substrate-binding protein